MIFDFDLEGVYESMRRYLWRAADHRYLEERAPRWEGNLGQLGQGGGGGGGGFGLVATRSEGNTRKSN